MVIKPSIDIRVETMLRAEEVLQVAARRRTA